MVENLSDKYWNQLHKSSEPMRVLHSFYMELFQKEYSRKDVRMFNKLLRIYGREEIFYTILDVYDMRKPDLYNPYPLFATIIKNRIKKKRGSEGLASSKDLTGEIRKKRKAVEKQKEILNTLRIPDIYDGE